MLSPPKSTSALVSRPRLIRLIDAAVAAPITVATGEAAAGKTSAVLDWRRAMSGTERPIGWLTVRRELDDPILFWRYLLAAVQPFGVETEELSRALSDDQAPEQRWLTVLANRLGEVPGEPVIVLDDLHEVTSPESLETLFTFLELAPPTVHVILLTRTKPYWPLAQWRVSGRLAEISSLDLRFTIDEAREWTGSIGLELGDDDMARLVELTEGWAGGMKLALLSVGHADDPSEFGTRFNEAHELVADYLSAVVLERLPSDLRAFLLDISILDDVRPEICDNLRERHDSRSSSSVAWPATCSSPLSKVHRRYSTSMRCSPRCCRRPSEARIPTASDASTNGPAGCSRSWPTSVQR